MNVIELTSIASSILLLVAAVVAGLYAWFTLGIWKTSIKQTKQSLLPLPVVYARNNGVGQSPRRRIFRIRNIGYGAALNIMIEPFILETYTNASRRVAKKFKYVLKMGDPNILVKDEERDLLSESYLNNQIFSPGDDLLFPHLHPEFATKKVPMTIFYQDITGLNYSIKIAFGTGKLEVINFPSELKSKTN